MYIFWIAILLLFISPAFYRLRSKGYPTAPFIVPTIILLVITSLSSPLYGVIISVLLPVALLLLTFFLPKKEGASGKTYFHINFDCPECGESITFARDQEGRAVLCPKCKELISVPSELGIKEPHYSSLPQNKETNDFVTISRFLNSDQADLASQQLEAAGIPTLLPDSATCHIYPGVGWAGGGSRLMVAGTDSDKAIEILNIPKAEICLPNDFIPPPATPEPEYISRVAITAFYSVLFLLIFPPILIQIWVWIVSLFFAEAVREGIIAESISKGAAIRITAIISLLFVAVAFLKEKDNSRNK